MAEPVWSLGRSRVCKGARTAYDAFDGGSWRWGGASGRRRVWVSRVSSLAGGQRSVALRRLGRRITRSERRSWTRRRSGRACSRVDARERRTNGEERCTARRQSKGRLFYRARGNKRPYIASGERGDERDPLVASTLLTGSGGTVDE